MSSASRKGVVLCSFAELSRDRARGFSVSLGGREFEVLAMLRADEVVVFENRCPHIGTPLNLVPDHFLDAAGEQVVCSTHGARFRLPDGHCVFGPCEGDALRRFEARLEGEAVVLTGIEQLESA